MLNTLILATCCVVACTGVPVELREPSLANTYAKFNLLDILVNLALFAPLGLLWQGRARNGIVAAAALSISVELVQFFAASRYPGGMDVASNTAGAAVGLFLQHRLPEAWVRSMQHIRLSGRRMGAVLLGAALLLCWLAGRPGPPADLSNWNPSYRFALGAEPTGERFWHGQLAEAAVWATDLPAASVAILARRQLRLPPIASDKDAADALPPPIYQYASGSEWPVILNPTESREIGQAMTESGKFTIAARMTVNSLTETGPARIMTLSDGLYQRNFTLGQERDILHFRLRTPSTGSNGFPPVTKSLATLKTGEEMLVTVTYDGTITRMYLDSTLTARENLAAAGHLFPDLADTELPLTALLAGLLSVGGMKLLWPSPWASAAGILAAVILLICCGTMSALPGYQPIALGIAAASAFVFRLAAIQSGARDLTVVFP